MSKLPVDQYMQNNARTKTEMRVALESIRDVVAEIGGGYTADSGTNWILEDLEILTGEITVPTSQFIKIKSEGWDVGPPPISDILNVITTTDLPDGRIIFLSNYSTTATADDSLGTFSDDFITVTHNGSPSLGQIKLADGDNNFILADKRVLVLVLRDTATTGYWEEIGRFYNGDDASLRHWAGIGDASLMEVATDVGTAQVRGKILKVSGSATPGTGNKLAINSVGEIVFDESFEGALTLSGISSSGFLQTEDDSLQTLSGELSIKTTSVIQGTTDSNLVIKSGGLKESILASIEGGNKVALQALTGSAGSEVKQGGIRIDGVNSKVESRTSSSDTWSDILTAEMLATFLSASSGTTLSGSGRPNSTGTGHLVIVSNDKQDAIKIEWGHNYSGVSVASGGVVHSFVGTSQPYTERPTILHRAYGAYTETDNMTPANVSLTGFVKTWFNVSGSIAGYIWVAIGKCAP